MLHLLGSGLGQKGSTLYTGPFVGTLSGHFWVFCACNAGIAHRIIKPLSNIFRMSLLDNQYVCHPATSLEMTFGGELRARSPPAFFYSPKITIAGIPCVSIIRFSIPVATAIL